MTVSHVTRNDGENMEPSIDDMADTLSATLRGLRSIDATVNRVLTELWVLEMIVALAAGILLFTMIHKVVRHG